MSSGILIFDTEATDLSPGQICQLSYLLEENDHITGHNYFFSVDDMSQGAFEVHGFSMEKLDELSGKTYFEDVAHTFLPDFNGARLWVGHNVNADANYLRVEMERAGLKLKKVPLFCTMNYASGIMNMKRKVVTGRPKPPKLSELAEYYEISPDLVAQKTSEWFQTDEVGLHDARYDTTMTYLCFKAGIQKGDLRGI